MFVGKGKGDRAISVARGGEVAWFSDMCTSPMALAPRFSKLWFKKKEQFLMVFLLRILERFGKVSEDQRTVQITDNTAHSKGATHQLTQIVSNRVPFHF